MIFEYACESCKQIVKADFRIGKAPEKVKCPDCKKKCSRHYGNVNFVLKGSIGSWPSKKLAFNKDQTKKNEQAEKRMFKSWGVPKRAQKPSAT